MNKIFVVIMFGGQYDDAWESNLRAFAERADADKLIAQYQKWAKEIAAVVEPEGLEDSDDIAKFWADTYEALEIPPEDAPWVDSLISEDKTGMTIDELDFVK
jgi:hypothetical protein